MASWVLCSFPQTPSAPTRCSGPSTLRGKPILRVRRGLGIEAPKHFHPATALGIPIGSIAHKEADAGLMKIGLGEELGTPSWPSHLFGDWRFRRYAPILRDSFFNSFSPSLLSAETIFHTKEALSCVPLANPSGTYSPVMTLPGPGLSGEQYFRAKIFPNAVLASLARLGASAGVLFAPGGRHRCWRRDTAKTFLKDPALRSVEDTPWLH